MATRVGIELSQSACRIVEIDAGSPWRASPAGGPLRSVTILPAVGPVTDAHLASLRGRPAAVVVWGAESAHRQVMVTDGSYEAMRVEGVAALAGAGLRIAGAWSDIAPAPSRGGGAIRRPVVVALASGAALSAAVQPLVDAGIRVRTVMTPAIALGSLARLRRSVSPSGVADAYVAVEAEGACLALVRDGALMAARDLSWGFTVERDGVRGMRSREDVVTRLAAALAEFIADVGGSVSAVARVAMCGGMPECRSMALHLIECLDIEVEPLDAPFGTDERGLSETTDEFRERGAELRLAWAAAADWPPAHNLLRARRRAASHAILARAAVLAGMAAGLGVGVEVAGSGWWGAAEPRLVARANAPRSGAAGDGPRQRVDSRAALAGADAGPSGQVAAPPVLVARPAAQLPPPPIALIPAPEPAPDIESSAAAEARPQAPPAPIRAASSTRGVSPAGTVKTPRPAMSSAPESGASLDMAVGSILYAPDRRLAIVDGRIVSAGDEVRGARVVDILPGAVLLRDAQGRLRRLALGASGR